MDDIIYRDCTAFRRTNISCSLACGALVYQTIRASDRSGYFLYRKSEEEMQYGYAERWGGVGATTNSVHCLRLKDVCVCVCFLFAPRSGELRTQKLKSHLMRTQSLKLLPLKPGVGQYIAMHATLTARDFFLANFYPSNPFTYIFFFFLPKPLLIFPCVSCG